MFEVNSKIETKTLINESQYFPDRLIEYLHRINDYFGCLPKPHLSQLSKLIGRNEADVFGVASFYHHFKIVDHTPLKKNRSCLTKTGAGLVKKQGPAF